MLQSNPMTLASPPARITPEELLDLESDGLFELVDGKLVEKKMSSLATKTVARISHYLFAWSEDFKRGEVYAEQSFCCFPDDKELIRRPDVSLIVANRLSQVPDEGHVPIAPDLAVEVVSPNDKIYELDEKLLDYRSAGVKLVWVVNPASRTIRIHRLDHTVSELDDSQTLDGESILPGFSIAVGELLPPHAPG